MFRISSTNNKGGNGEESLIFGPIHDNMKVPISSEFLNFEENLRKLSLYPQEKYEFPIFRK